MIVRSVAEVLENRVELEVESIDRVYLNLYVPMLQSEPGVAHFWRQHRGHDFASSALMGPMTAAFVRAIDDFIEREAVERVNFRKGQRKEDIAKQYLSDFEGDEGVLFVGVAQEKATVCRTRRQHNPSTGASYAWLYKTLAPV